MLSRRTWAGLAAGTGLGFLLAGTAIAGWWLLDVRYQPVRVGAADTIGTALKDAPSIQLYPGQRPVYVIGPRDSAQWEHWTLNEARELSGLEREVRTLIIPSGYGGAAEETTVAQLWLHPDQALLNQWLERSADLWTGAGLPSLRRDPVRQQALDKAVAFARSLERETDTTGRWPLVFWHDPAGALVVCVCDTPQAQERARKTLGLAGRARSIIPEADTVQNAPQPDRGPDAAPYPQGQPLPKAPALPTQALNEPARVIDPPAVVRPAPRLPGDVTPAPPQKARTTPSTAPAARPRSRVVNTAPPEASKEADSLFY